MQIPFDNERDRSGHHCSGSGACWEEGIGQKVAVVIVSRNLLLAELARAAVGVFIRKILGFGAFIGYHDFAGWLTVAITFQLSMYRDPFWFLASGKLLLCIDSVAKRLSVGNQIACSECLYRPYFN